MCGLEDVLEVDVVSGSPLEMPPDVVRVAGGPAHFAETHRLQKGLSCSASGFHQSNINKLAQIYEAGECVAGVAGACFCIGPRKGQGIRQNQEALAILIKY